MNFFIDRPIFASAIAILMVLAGAIAMLVLPVSQYPPLVPPQVQISTQYIGAGAEIVAPASGVVAEASSEPNPTCPDAS